MDETASSLERLMACPASAVLPHVAETNDDADRGTEIHSFVRNVSAGMPRAKALALVPKEHLPVCEGIDFGRVCGDLSNVRAEVSYAIDVETSFARELGINLGRHYPTREPAEFAGTNDLEGRRLDDVEVVADVKTGDPVTACRENPQMMFHARARQLRTGAAEVEARLIYIRRDGKVSLDCAMFTAFELDCFEDELSALRARIEDARARFAATGQVSVSTGPHCRYCPAMTACPRYVALARTMAADVADIPARLEMLTPEQQGIAWEKAKAIEKLVEHVLDGLKAIAKQGEFPLPTGKVVKAISFARQDFSRDKTLALLREKGATQAEIEALYTEATVTQVREGAGPKQLGAPKRSRALKVA